MELRSERATPRALLPLVAAGGIAIIGVESPQLALVLVFGLLTFALVGSFAPPRPLAAGDTAVARFKWVPVAWVLLFFVSDLNFVSGRDPLAAAAGSASLANLIELGVYAAAGISLALTWRTVRSDQTNRWTKAVLWAIPMLAIVSAAWSSIPTFSLVRAGQLLVPVGLATVLIDLWKTDPDAARALLRKVARGLVFVAACLTVVAFIVGGSGNAARALGRLAWPGSGPDGTGAMLGAALLVLIFGRKLLQLRSWAYWLLLGTLGSGLLLTRTRAALAAVLIAFVVVRLWSARGDRVLRYVGFAYLVLGALVVWTIAQEELIAIVSRGQSLDTLATLNNRLPLWEVAIEEMQRSSAWLFGFGYGASRTILFEQVHWAGTAHNAWIEILLGTGVLGLLLWSSALLSSLVRVRRIVRAHAWDPAAATAAALGLFFLVVSMAQPAFALPGFAFSMLALVVAVSIGVATEASSDR